MRACLFITTVAALPLAACFDLDFHSTGTSVTATSQTVLSSDPAEQGQQMDTEISICGGPSDLLDCNEDKDSFSVSLEGQTEEAAPDTFISFGEVYASFPGDSGGMTIGVTRDQDGASGSVVMPDGFDLEASTGPYHAGDLIELSWTPSHGDSLAWTGFVDCGLGSDGDGSADDETTSARSLDDNGHAIIDTRYMNKPEHGTCSAGITLTRTRTGTMSAAYGDDSSVTATQVETLAFDLED